jgi:hypothetical protein
MKPEFICDWEWPKVPEGAGYAQMAFAILQTVHTPSRLPHCFTVFKRMHLSLS